MCALKSPSGGLYSHAEVLIDKSIYLRDTRRRIELLLFNQKTVHSQANTGQNRARLLYICYGSLDGHS